MKDENTIVHLLDKGGVDGLLKEDLALLYKHSPACGISSLAQEEVHLFSRTHPEVPVYQLDVIAERPLSLALADRLQVPHKSPQVILLRKGEAIWHTSHFKVRAVTIEQEIGSSGNLPSVLKEE